MSQMSKVSSGLVFRDEFNNPMLDPGWLLSPSDTTLFDVTALPGWVRISHSNSDVMMLRNVDPYPCVIDIKNNYNPTVNNDEGGLIVFNDPTAYFSFVEYFDAVKGTAKIYPYMRLIRTSVENFACYGSNDGSIWELIASVKFPDPVFWGLVMTNNDPTFSKMDVDYVRIYKSQYITVGNLMPGQKVELYNEFNSLKASSTCLVGSSTVQLDCRNLVFPFKGSYRLYDINQALKYGTAMIDEIWGGDQWDAGYALEVYRYDYATLLWVRVFEETDFTLGTLTSVESIYQFKIQNADGIVFSNIKLSVYQYNQEFGYQWVDVAEHNSDLGQPGIFKDVINLGNLAPGNGEIFWVKITRSEMMPIQIYPYRFRLSVQFD